MKHMAALHRDIRQYVLPIPMWKADTANIVEKSKKNPQTLGGKSSKTGFKPKL